MISFAPQLAGPWASQPVDMSAPRHTPMWIESAWRDPESGIVFGWYHHEPGGVCGADSGLSEPKIGAVISYDGGRSVIDLGIVLAAGDLPDCNSRNGFFAGGHGDFSVVLDPERRYFYFFFTNYAGPTAEQGVAVARLAFEDRFQPVGAVFKYYRGRWNEPGIYGHMTPVFPARVTWQNENTDSHWGAAVHWNTALQQFVMLLNRSCCSSGWPQEGIYLSMTGDLAEPASWSGPVKLLDDSDLPDKPAYYPQVIGLGGGETDSIAGSRVRLVVQGVSHWEIEFRPPTESLPLQIRRATTPRAVAPASRGESPNQTSGSGPSFP